jgi:hypothetical protein
MVSNGFRYRKRNTKLSPLVYEVRALSVVEAKARMNERLDMRQLLGSSERAPCDIVQRHQLSTT